MGTQGGPVSLQPPWRTVLVTLVVLLLAMTSSNAQRMQRCARPPRFAVNDVEPMALTQGHVTLVALLTNTCPFCIQQSRRLETLYQELQGEGSDVKMMVIDAGPLPAPGQPGVFESIVSFDVYHDDNQQQIWRQVFKGNKDDILVFNRCGMLTYHINFPYSYLGYNYVRRALALTGSNHRICSSCNLHTDPHDVMMGDAPISEGGMHLTGHRGRGHHQGRNQGHHTYFPGQRRGGNHGNLGNRNRNRNRSRCPKNDSLCRELRRGRRRYNRFRTAHGIGKHSHLSEEQILGMMARGGNLPRLAPAA